MANKGRIEKVPLVLLVIFVAFFEVSLSLPLAIQSNGRALRSVNRKGNWNENPTDNLLLTQPPTAFAQRELISTGDGSPETLDSPAGNGTLNNGTLQGSRLKRNETEPCNLEPASLCTSDPTHSNRDKQRRIENIKNYLLINLLGNRTRPGNGKIVTERFSGGLESIPVSCDLPSEVESDAWSSNRYFSLYFNLSSKFPDVYSSTESTSTEVKNQSLESGQSHEYNAMIGNQPFASKFTVTPTKSLNIITAKLRLYKAGISEETNTVSVGNIERSESYNDTETSYEQDALLPNVFSTRMTFPKFSPSRDEKIRVSVFWYTQPATKNHYKKKLVDTKMLSLRESSWIEFDIKNAVAAWLNDRKPNYGLVVEVENENQDVLDPRKYFHGAPCFKSSAATGSPLQDGNEGIEDNNNRSVNSGETPSSTYPMIEICTLNVPDTTASYEHTKFFPFNMNSISHLQRVAESHSRSSNSSKFRTSPWHTMVRGLTPEDFGMLNPTPTNKGQKTTAVPTASTHHKHRHHHNRHALNNQNNNGQSDSSEDSSSESHRNKPRYSHSRGGFTLHEDHPLREILASVNGNSKETSKRASQFVESVGSGLSTHLFSDMPADEGRASLDYVDSTEHERDVIITKIVITPAQLKESGLSRIANSRGFSTSSPTDVTNTASSER